MRLWNIFKPKKKLSEAERKWNLMWDMWAHDQAISPYAELMKYESEVNNGGHSQYFFNVSNCGDLSADVKNLLKILPDPLRNNLKRGYEAFSAQEDIAADDNEELFEECDDVFYENEHLLIEILRIYADSLSL